MSDDLIRRGAALEEIEAKVRAQWTDATSASEKNDERRAERHRSAARVLEKLAERIRALPAVAREPEAAPSPLSGLPDDVRHRLVALAHTDVFVSRMLNAIRGGMREAEAMAETIAGLASAQARLVAEAVDARAKSTQTVLISLTPSPPTCATCGGSGLRMCACCSSDDEPDSFDWTCPACAGGRRA